MIRKHGRPGDIRLVLERESVLVRILYYLGIIRVKILETLEPQIFIPARISFRWWYPFTWVFVFISVFVMGVALLMEERPYAAREFTIYRPKKPKK